MLYLLIKPLALSLLLNVAAHKLATHDGDTGYHYELDNTPEGFDDKLIPDDDFIPDLPQLEVKPGPQIMIPPDEA